MLDMLHGTRELIDIGSDHGILCAYAVTTGKAAHAIAADISADSLGKARALIKELSLEDRVSFAVSDGFLSIDTDEESYSAVIAGMGGELIARILEGGGEKAERAAEIAMQPMGGAKELRKYLYANGFNITDESVIEDGGRYYQLILAHYDGIARPTPAGGLLEFGEIAYQKREAALKKLLDGVCATRSRKLENAMQGGAAPKELINDLHDAEKLRAEW